MSEIVIYADKVEQNPTEGSFIISGDLIIAGRSYDLRGDKINTVKVLLNLLIEQLGNDAKIEFRERK